MAKGKNATKRAAKVTAPAVTQPKKKSAREIIVAVLKRNGGEMATKDVVAKVLPKWESKGKYADHSVYGTMLHEAKKPDGKIIQTRPGYFKFVTDESERALNTATRLVKGAEVTDQVTPDPKKPDQRRTRSTARKVKEEVTA